MCINFGASVTGEVTKAALSLAPENELYGRVCPLFIYYWRWIFRQLLLVLVSPLHFQLIEEDGWGHDAVWNIHHAVIDVAFVSGGDQIAAQGTNVEISERPAANQFFMPILSPDFIQKPRREPRAKGFHIVAKGQVALLAQFDKLFLQLVFRKRLRGGHDKVPQARPGRISRNAGAPMAVGSRKITNGLTADNVIHEHALFDERDFLRWHTLIVYRIVAQQSFSFVRRNRRIIDHRQEIWQNTRLVAGCEPSRRARILP